MTDIRIDAVTELDTGADAVILPCFEDPNPDIYGDIDTVIGGLIGRTIASREFKGKQNQLTLIHVRNLNAARLLLVGFGKESLVSPEKLRQAGGKALTLLRDIGAGKVALSTRLLQRITLAQPTARKPVYYFLEGGLLGLYLYERYKKPEEPKELKEVIVLGGGDPDLKWLRTTLSAVNFARDLINTPSNDMTPGVLAEAAKTLAGRKVKVTVLERRDAEREGMESYLSVARGSEEPPKFIVLEYKGARKPPIALIGKSITFDSGGISLKPAEGMEKMKYDMAGGAAVLGVIKAVSELALPVHVMAVLPATENLPGGRASKPGDVVKTIAGKTIEIINTDAEGRLALADGIGYALRHARPAAVIDIATLTGACSVALGNEAIAMMGTGEALMDAIRKASEETSERVWRMPLYDEYKEYIKSDVADLKNSGGKTGSLVTAGYFLKECAAETPWVHLDIAGTAWNDKDKPYLPKGATGIGVRLLLHVLKEMSS